MDKIKLYVIGYPRSGNTWVTRLFAHLYNLEVKVVMGNHEIATEINDRISSDSKNGFIGKGHYTIDNFRQIDSDPERVIYLSRDFPSVAISSFFYFYESPDFQEYYRLFRWTDLLLKPKKIFVYRRNRKRLNTFIEDLLLNGVPWFGTWTNHLEGWKSNSLKGACCFSDYNQLVSNTRSEVERIIKELQLPKLEEGIIDMAIASESFDLMKKRNSTDQRKGEGRLMYRKADPTDWRNYLDDELLARIEDHLRGDASPNAHFTPSGAM
ncbi:sulfotransferase domain-containing protein [Marinoscillum sp. 108]|uniref:sulfotransferase domain-containing protein n=1 Tax=Marinoscillum sp. 108 TaxID=2653151 RepID=UPI0012F33069|nr:sulfotransferase domain-containing protein [Marinoscillum sp. 108]VXD20515.1 hypothetical protein MARINOS108_50019 [Marinoscillum sp. 108]